MPEPVVIIGPAARPAGSIVGPADVSAENAALTPEDSGGPAGPAGRAIGRRILRRSAALLARGLLAAGAATLRAIRRNPRTSLAAGASVLILGSISVSQWQSGNGKHSLVTNRIGGNLLGPAAKDQRNTGGTKTEATAPGRGNTATAAPGNTAAAGSGNKETAPADATSRPDLPAPARSVDDTPPIPALTDAATTGQKHEIITEKSAPAFELASGPKAERQPAPAPAHEQKIATLLASPVPEKAPAPSLPVAQADKGGPHPAQTGQILDPPAPASMPAVASTSLPIEPAPVPAPAREPLQLAAALEFTDDGPKPAQKPAPDPVANSQGHDGDTAVHQLPGDRAPTETKPIEIPVSGPRPDPAPNPNASTPKPKSPEKDHGRPETSKTEVPNLVSSTPKPQAALKADGPATKPAAPLQSHGASEAHPDAARPAALPIERGAPPTKAVAPRAENVAAKSEIPAQSTTVRPDSGSPIFDSTELATRIAEPEPRTRSSDRSGPHVEPSTLPDRAGAGWISIPNTGKLPVDGEASVESRSGDAGTGLLSESTTTRDLRAHTAKNVSFELESSPPRIRPRGARDQTQIGERSAVSSGSRQEPRAGSDSARVELVPHLVEHGENFWTISRLYYNSGRYHRALWKANSDRYPDINVLHVGDTIMIPPIEDLDQAYILPPRTPTAPALAAAERSHERSNDEPETRTAYRPQRSGTASPSRPVYKVRPYDTLRSIARDTLDDSRRANEILELNRGIIDDETHLIVGQIIELPEDARTTLHRSTSRR
ncbi:MAG: LysM peptidoglycan-binding domain-containing protein [Isosphaerales bacterium]